VKLNRHVCTWALSLALVFGLLGCATKRIDWSSRVGSYTYDQAISELGPPERSAKFTDGSTVAEWLETRGLRSGFVSGGFANYGPYYGHHGFYGSPMFITESSSPDICIRLTFDAEGKLVIWKRVNR